jgi:nucleoside-diphosphate-sugar epimerase
MKLKDPIIGPDDQILVTGASGFIGSRVLAALLENGFRKVRCLIRPSSDFTGIAALIARYSGTAQIEVIRGTLLSRNDCLAAAKEVAVIYHLGARPGGRSYPDAFMNAVVTTRNLLEASIAQKPLPRFVNVSSFAVYTNRRKPHRRLLDESCPTEQRAERCGEPYCYAKIRQDELVIEYSRKHGLPYVIVRPGVVYGPGHHSISGRIGLGTFGLFLHLGGSNTVPFTYVDNCADAIVLAGVTRGIEHEVFNVVDDNLPSSRQFLRAYKRQVKPFRSLYVPRFASYLLCLLWEKMAAASRGQLPEFVDRRAWHAYWKGSKYSNAKLKNVLGWQPRVSTREGLERFFESCRNWKNHA